MSSRCVASSGFRFSAKKSKRSLCRTISLDVQVYSTAAGSSLSFPFLLFFLPFFGAERAERAVLMAGKTVRLRARKSCFYKLVERRERERTQQAAQIPVCVAAAVPLRASALIKRASP